MRIYCVSYDDHDRGTVLHWTGSRQKAERFAREAGPSISTVIKHEIPTDKTGLVDWLNKHFDLDNG